MQVKKAPTNNRNFLIGENKMTTATKTTTTETPDDDQLLEHVLMQDLLLYANDISDQHDVFIPPSAKASKEDLIDWISTNDPSHNPEAE
jgi:hypothetical protein